MEIKGNDRSDELAKRGATERPFTPLFSIAHARRLEKASVLEGWKHEWLAEVQGGGFAIANRRPPSFATTRYFKTLPRELFSRTMQCRTGHAHIGEYYSRFVPSELTDCVCGANPQTREHILKECTRHEYYRMEILDEEMGTEWRMADLLGSTTGIPVLAEFLRRSGAYLKS